MTVPLRRQQWPTKVISVTLTTSLFPLEFPFFTLNMLLGEWTEQKKQSVRVV